VFWPQPVESMPPIRGTTQFSRQAPQGPKRAATTGAGRLPVAPLRCAMGACRGLARTRQHDAGTRQKNSLSTLDTLLVRTTRRKGPATHLTRWPRPRLSLGSRIAPLAIMKGTVRHGTRQGRLRRPSGMSDP
jgi:hypothetical protein